MTTDGTVSRQPLRVVRRVIVAVIIVSFGLAALGGIIVLLGGSLGSEGGRVLGTTAVVGAFSVAVLCCAALVGRRVQLFGFVGAAVSAVTAACVLWIIWYRGDYSGLWDIMMKLTWTGVALTVAFAFASLLLLLADREQTAVRIGLAVTLVLFGIVLAMTIYLIWWPASVDGDLYGRVLGIFAILAALGAVVVPVVSLLLRAPRPSAGLSDASRALLEREAARRGLTPDELVSRLLGAPEAYAEARATVDPR